MVHNDSQKVVSIFKKHLSGEQSHTEAHEGTFTISPDGFNYLTSQQLQGDEVLSEDDLLEIADKKHYVIKMLEHHQDFYRVNNYHVPGKDLERFLLSLSSRPGRLLEIKQFLPDTTA